MKKYQEYLKSLYKSLDLISPLEMLDCFSTEYINLTMLKEEEDDPSYSTLLRDGSYDSITLAEALDEDNQKERKVILILGGPGMGKSILAINICKQWAEGNLLQKYDAVILLILRDKEIQGAKTYKDLLQILDDDLRDSVYKEIVKCNGEKICFIYEGYDELPYHLQRAPVFTKLIEKLHKCTLVYTSRPEAYYRMPYRCCKVIKINGFDEESVDKYISEAFKKYKNGEEMAQKLKTQVHSNPVIRSILHIPINVAIVCLIFFHHSTLPKTLTELYTLLCLRLILRYIVTRTPNEGQVEKLLSLDNLPTGVSDQFLQLCHVAYKGMENEKIIFSSQDLTEIGVTEGNLRGMGLLLIAPTTTVAGREKCYNFLHLTLQEFCAAWYISKLSAEEQVLSIKVSPYREQLKMVWRFYSGITKLQNKELLEYMLPCEVVKSPFSHQKALELINIAYEASSSEVCEIVGNYFNDESSVINLDELQSHAINYVLTQYKGLLQVSRGGIKVLIDWSQQHKIDVNLFLENMAVQYLSRVHELSVSVTNIKLISQILSNSRTLKILHIFGCHGHSELTCLAKCKSVLLQNLTISQCRLDLSSLAAIGEMLSYNNSIKLVDLSSNCITDDGIEKLVHHLMDNNTLQQINFCHNSITADGVTHLRKLFTKEHSALTSIELSKNPLMDEGVDLLLKSLPLGVEHIGLCDVQMTSLSCQSLGDALHKVRSISFDQVIEFEINEAYSNKHVNVTCEYLKVINNYVKKICTDFWEVITTNLLSTTVLEHLEVRLTDSPNVKLINAIGQNQGIKTLKLFYWMGDENVIYTENNWATELAQCIQCSTSLEHLIISGVTDDSPSHVFEYLMYSVTISTSIKSVVYELAGQHDFGADLNIVYEFIDKLKQNSTLVKLTLNKVYIYTDMGNELFVKIENCVQRLNKIRNIKGIPNLKVNITCVYI